MKTSECISTLRSSPKKRLMFVNAAGETVPRGYHLTEIKAASYETVDCGGQLNDWNETIIQLWVPEVVEAREDHMIAEKFLAIFDKVSGLVPLDMGGEIRIEYGDERLFPSIYHITSIGAAEDALVVLLAPPEMTCKAKARRRAQVATSSCCEPAAAACC